MVFEFLVNEYIREAIVEEICGREKKMLCDVFVTVNKQFYFYFL